MKNALLEDNAELRRKLAECEQQRDALAGMDHAAEHYRKERDDAERKLAAAREAMPLFGKKLHCLYLEVEPSIANDIMESYKELFAALTEAGECCVVCGKSLASGCDCGKTEAGEEEKK